MKFEQAGKLQITQEKHRSRKIFLHCPQQSVREEAEELAVVKEEGLFS